MSGSIFRDRAGFFMYSDRTAQINRAMRIFYSCPQSDVRDAPIIMQCMGLTELQPNFETS